MHTLALLAALALSNAPAEKTVRFGKVTIVLSQSIAIQDGVGSVRCALETLVDGGTATHKRISEGQIQSDFTGCFSLPRSQEMPGFYMMRDSQAHTLLVSEKGEVFDLENLVARSGRWDPAH